MDRPARPDDGSPARLIAIMVGIVGILLLGSLAWSAVGAMFSVLGEATAAFSAGPTPVRLSGAVGTATAIGAPTSPPAAAVATTLPPTTLPAPTLALALPGVTTTATSAPVVDKTPTPASSGRAPWVLLPQPAPNAHVVPGPLVIEARGRGDAPIAAIRLDLDGVPLPVSLEQRSESTWRGVANTRVASGTHAVRATVVDDQGRTGSFRWTFDASP